MVKMRASSSTVSPWIGFTLFTKILTRADSARQSSEQCEMWKSWGSASTIDLYDAHSIAENSAPIRRIKPATRGAGAQNGAKHAKPRKLGVEVDLVPGAGLEPALALRRKGF